ncbi:MAG: protein kinase [Acidobacteriia bacterium]|nr:protein kinase [Terriglobia bacterium]
MIGTTLSHYRITEKLGAGGMGEVYRAEDTNLDRPVAIKVLPDIFSGDPERLARFEREAKLLASLNHQNIAAIYGLEEAGGKRFLVLELVEGETLAQRIAKGPLPVEEALEVCRQIAEGVEAAHEKGIIHRDLKPANVKITPEGRVKVLDFGLARAFQGEAAAADASKSPTLTDQMTRPGVILGTAAYMAPEQAKGKAVDKRADIWAFGCVLYECLTGKRAFQGETITEIVASILKSDPDLDALPADTPPMVRSLLRRCLQKDPVLRLHDIGDARIEIGESVTYPSEAALGPRRLSPLWLAVGAAVMLLVGILLGWLLTKSQAYRPAASVAKSIIKVEQGLWLDGSRTEYEAQRPNRTAMAISGDGSFVVYSAIGENPDVKAKPQLYLRRIDQLEAKPIAGTEGGINPFLSPDNRWVGYWASGASGQLKKVPVEGGVPATVCDAPSIFGASWGIDNSIIFASGSGSGLKRVSADGGTPEDLPAPDPKRVEWSHRLPSWLPNGKAVLFTVMRDGYDAQPRIALMDLKTRQWRTLFQDAADARYLPPGYLVFLRQGILMASRFDADRMEAIGQPYPVVANVMQALGGQSDDWHSGAGQFAISASGSVVYAAGGMLPPPENSLVWVDQKGGSEQPAVPFKFPFFVPRLSPDDRRIAYATLGRERQIWVYDIGTGTNIRLTGEGRAGDPIWAPDGKRIAFYWSKSLSSNIFWQPYDQSSLMERLTTSTYSQYPSSWSHGSKTIAMIEDNPNTGLDIVFLDTSSGKVSPFLNSKYRERYPEFSPNGTWIAYTSDDSRRDEIYVRPVAGTGGKWPITNDGGLQPMWARNGRQIFYRRQDQVWVVDIQTEGGFAISNRRMLFERPGYTEGAYIRSYDVSLDSQRFLVVKNGPSKPTPVTEMILVQNWFEELRRLVPTGK